MSRCRTSPMPEPPRFMWCGVGQYAGRKPFIFGTVAASDRGQAAEQLALLWRQIMPFKPPEIEPMRGQLIFQAGESDS